MTRVYVGMSGGVDSSLTAALLVEQGYDVTGVYMKNWSQDLPGMKCPWAEDLADAKRVAVQLGIDFKVFDFEAEYKQYVVDYMIDEYKAGRTPNPDIMCNQEVKFKLFLQASLADGADMIATGHYARVARAADESAPERLHAASQIEHASLETRVADCSGANSSATTRLLMAKDENKDQTYFLYRVTEGAMRRTLFPLGEYTKPQVREMAHERGLWTATKKESMGVCFVGSVGMREFLGEYVTTRPGDIIDKASGKMLGRHEGAMFYTLGQRHGLDVGGGLPYYVVGKDMDKNEVYVSTNLNDQAMWQDEIHLSSVHWINQSVTGGIVIRTRHRGALIPARIEGDVVKLEESQRAVTPGQSVVFYRDDVCLGGGIVI